MALVKFMEIGEATGMIKQVYDGFITNAGIIPEPLFYYSCSPEFFEAQMVTFEYYRHHKTLTPMTLAAVRYFAALDSDFPACIEFNTAILKLYGTDEAVIPKLKGNPELLNLSEREHALVAFTRKALQSPESVTGKDMDHLKDLGWKDSEIMDATIHGAMLLRSGLIMKIFNKD